MTYYAYILESEIDGSFYVGATQDIVSRLDRHNQGRTKYTKAKRPWKLVFTETFETRSEALARELEIKGRKSRRYIESLVRASRLA
jgi:putative endonuclease